MKTEYSKKWISSKQPRKQRKYRINAPLNKLRKFVSTHLSKELKLKYKKRNIPVIKGDTVKIMRGQFKGRTGKVSRVDYKKSKVFVEGIDNIKKDGNKLPKPIDPSNLMITSLILEDKKRIISLERK